MCSFYRAWFGQRVRIIQKRNRCNDLKILSWKVSFWGFMESQEKPFWTIFVATGRLNFQWNSLLWSCALGRCPLHSYFYHPVNLTWRIPKSYLSAYRCARCCQYRLVLTKAGYWLIVGLQWLSAWWVLRWWWPNRRRLSSSGWCFGRTSCSGWSCSVLEPLVDLLERILNTNLVANSIAKQEESPCQEQHEHIDTKCVFLDL